MNNTGNSLYSRKIKIAFNTLGCRLNQFETDSIASKFLSNGYEVVDYSDNADVYIINTCTVTNKSGQKSRNIINRAVKKENESLVLVTGCFVASDREYLEGRDGITYIVDNENKSQIFNLVDGHLKGEIVHPSNLASDQFSFNMENKGLLTRTMIKIQDGCDNFCSYCIIPFVRGSALSRDHKDIINSVKNVIKEGYKEIILTGVNIGRYKSGDINFSLLLKTILDMPGDFRLRISSIEPEPLDNDFVEILNHPKLCPHLHICIQSGSDRILSKMNREYTIKQFSDLIKNIRTMQPDFNLTTDLIVGFPGETDDDFNESCKVLDDLAFSHVHTFKYSRRKGTAADKMKTQVNEKIKTERSESVRKIAEKNKMNYRKSFIGKTQRVLVESEKAGGYFGYGEHYLPVIIMSDTTLYENTFHDVLITGIIENEDLFLTGKLI